MASVLDLVCVVVFGGWAYLVAKRKRRDEIIWAIAAAVTFYITGYVMQAVAFPVLAKSCGWPGAWQKPAGFLVGGFFALALDLCLTFVVPPRPEPDRPSAPESAEAEGGEEQREDSEAPPEGGGADDGERA